MKKSDKSIILMLVGVVLAAASYFLVYQNLTEKTEEMNRANATLSQEVAYLQELADNKQKYIDDTAAMQAEIEEIKAQFPAQYLPEDEILYLIATERSYDAVVQTIDMEPAVVVNVENPAQEAPAAATTEDAAATGDAATTETAAPAEPVTPDIMLYRTEVTASVLSTYNSVKDVIKQINTDKDRKSIDTLSVAFDSDTGALLSTIGFSMYSLTGTEAEYKKPSVSGVAYGTNDIFNSVEKKAKAEAQRSLQSADE